MKIFKILIILLFFIPAYSFAGQCPTKDGGLCKFKDYKYWFDHKSKHLIIVQHSFYCVSEKRVRKMMNLVIGGHYRQARNDVDYGCNYIRFEAALPVQILKLSKDKKVAEILVGRKINNIKDFGWAISNTHYYVATRYIMILEQYKKTTLEQAKKEFY